MQRQDYKLVQLGKTTRLTDRRKRLLDEVGFVWEIPRKGRRLRTAKPINNPNPVAPSPSVGSEEGESLEPVSFVNSLTSHQGTQPGPTAPPLLMGIQPQIPSPGNPTMIAAPANTGNPTSTAPAFQEALTTMLNSILQAGGGTPLPPHGASVAAPASFPAPPPPPPVVQAPQPPPATPNDSASMFLNMLVGALQNAQQQQPQTVPVQVPQPPLQAQVVPLQFPQTCKSSICGTLMSFI